MIGSLTTAVGRNKKGEGRTISKPILLFTERVQATSVLRPVNHYGYIRAKKERKKERRKKKKRKKYILLTFSRKSLKCF